MARRQLQKNKQETALHKTVDLAALLERARTGDSALAVKAYLDAGGSANCLAQGGGAGGAQQLPLLHHMALCNDHPHTELAESVRLLVAAGGDIHIKSAGPGDYAHTAVMYAVQRTCCNKVVHAFLQNGADLSVLAADGTTPLHVAAAAGRVDSCELLLARADGLLHANDNKGCTALMQAAKHGCLDVKLLLQYGADMNAADNKNRTPLIMSTLNQHEQVVLCLLTAGADVNAVDCGGHGALVAAVQTDSSTLLQLLLDNGADISATDNGGQNALFKAAHLGHVHLMEILVQRGLGIEAVDSTGTTALMIAVANGQKLAAEWLLQQGAAVNAVDVNGYTALHAVNVNSHSDAAAINELLLANGADVHKRTNDGCTALNVAANQGHIECVKVLIAAGADVNSADSGDLTNLHMAVTENHGAIAQLLLEHGATAVMNEVLPITCKSSNDCCCLGMTALMMCTTAATAKVLLAAGADVHVTTDTGDICLQLAASHRLPVPVVCLLIKAGADLHAVNHEGKTAAQIAHDRGSTLIEQLLIRAAQ
jgi:uncharacterized protein